MISPYDWQEGIGHRAAYVQGRLASGTPVIMISLEEGILAFTVRRNARKVFEIYDRLIFAAIGQQSDVESLRVAAIDFTHQEGYQRSEDDVTIQRVVNALSQPLKRSFADFNSAPFVAQALFAEVGATRADDVMYLLDYDGDFSLLRDRAYLAGTAEAGDKIHESLRDVDLSKMSSSEAIEAMKKVWAGALDPEGKATFESLTANLSVEAALLSRSGDAEQRFRSLF